MPGCSAVDSSNRTEQGFTLKVFPRDPQRRKLWASKVKIINWDSLYCREIQPAIQQSRIVPYKKLLDYQKDMELSLTPKLTPSHLDNKHFDKMKVSKAADVFSQDVGAALHFFASEKNDTCLKTTAWFIQHIHKWFSLMTSRHPIMAISKFNLNEYVKTISFLAEIISLFQNLKVQNFKDKIVWKPIQTGVIMATISMLKLQSILLREKKFKFILTSRFCQDYVENFFNLIRSKQVIPTALQFRNHLKTICVSQFLRKCGGSYDIDKGQFLPGMLDLFKKKTNEF